MRCRTGCCGSSRPPRSRGGEEAVDALFRAWGPRFFVRERGDDAVLLADCVEASGLDDDLVGAGTDEKWDVPIVASMEVAYAFGGNKTQTPTIVVREDPPYGFKGPVMAPAPTGAAALRLWDAIQVIAQEPGFFEITRPRVNRPPSAPHRVSYLVLAGLVPFRASERKPLKDKALPYLPEAVHAAPLTVPVFPLPEVSAAVVPDPSSKP